jgi:uncharacterized protein (DUF1330 family)
MNISRTWLAAAAGSLAIAAAAGNAGAQAPGPKGYIVAEITVNDAEAYKAYTTAVTPLVAKFGGTYLVRGGQTVTREGEPPKGRVAIIEFPSLAAAQAFQDSPEYAAVAPLRHKAATSRLYIAEGPAPAAPQAQR